MKKQTEPLRKKFEDAAEKTEAPSGGLIVCLSCVKSKRTYPCAAKDMYVSDLFKKMLSYAESLKPQKIFILSAKYGLLNLDDVIEPYERTLNNMNPVERAAWAKDVLTKIAGQSDIDRDRFVFLAGQTYRENLVPYIKHASVPMKGLSFGRQLQWLGKKSRAPKP